MARPTALKFTGTFKERKDANGNVVVSGFDRYIVGIPARDLDEADIAQLTDEELANATGGRNPLYVEPKASKSDGEKAKGDAKAPAKSP